MRAFQLGYIDLASAEFENEVRYYEDVIGATVVDRSNDAAYLSLGVNHHNVSLVSSPESGLQSIGLQIAGEGVSDIAKRLRDRGLHGEARSDSRPGVPKLVRVTVPGGHTFDLYSEMTVSAPGFKKSGIIPNRLGHVAVLSADAEKLITFLVDVLGFKLTDWLDGLATFLTCNYDHHVLNVVAAPITKLHHVAFELRSREHHYDAADILGAAGYPILWGPARHTAGHNLASYHLAPGGYLTELYAELDVFVPELNAFEPRPWHETLPLRPQVWPASPLTGWRVEYAFDLKNL